MKKLTVKLEAFCEELARTDNQSAAYRFMLPDTKALDTSIWTRAWNLAKRPEVKRRVAELKAINREVAEKEYRKTEGQVIQEIARLAFNDPRNCFDNDGNLLPIKDWPVEVAATISSIKVVEKRAGDDVTTEVKEIKFWDKGKQIELAAKHLGMLVDKKEVKLEGEIITAVKRTIVDGT